MSTKVLTSLVVALLALGVGTGVAFYLAGGTGRSQPVDPVQPTYLSADDVAARFLPGPPWNGKGNGDATLEDAANVQNLTPLWLGTQFGGYNLQAVLHQDYSGPDGRSVNKLVLIYGDCKLQSGGDRPTCSVPLEVHVESVCAVRPEQVAGTVKLENGTLRGGAQSVRFTDGHVVFWSGSSMVTIHAPGQPNLVNQAAQALRSLRSADGVTAGASLAAPDFSSCK